MIGHETSRELAAITLDFDLSPEEQAELDGHLAACEACRRYVAALANDVAGLAALPLVDAPERVRRVVLAGGRRRRLSATSWTAIAAVLALTILPLATAVVLLREIGGGSIGAAPGVAETTQPSPAASGAPPASQEPGATGAPEVPLDPAQLAWQPVVVPPSGDEPPVTMLNAVVHAPDLSWYAVGAACGGRESTESDPSVPSLCAPAVLRSEDGVDWSRVPNVTGLTESFERPGPSAGMYDVVAGGPGLVAVGVSNNGLRADPAVWVSGDGRTWERVVVDDPRSGWMVAVTTTDDGSLVAVGAAYDLDGHGPPGVAAWRSGPNGRSWEPIPTTTTAESPDVSNDGLMLDVTTFEGVPLGIGQVDRGVVTFGIDDLGHWAPLTGPDAFAEADWFPQSIAASDGGLLVTVGWRRPDVGRHEPNIAWRSKDGEAWQLGSFEPTVEGRRNAPGQGLRVVTAVGDAFVAGGTQVDAPPGLWLSLDGDEWIILPGSEPIDTGDVYGLGAGADRMVAVGETQPEGGEPAIWVGLPEGVVP